MMILLESSQNNCLLSYGIDTDPIPLQVSPQEGNPSYAALTVVVSNNTTNAIYCNRITFSFPIGDLAQDLTVSYVGILVSAAGPKDEEGNDEWRINNNNNGTFTATPTKPMYNEITTDGLVFQIYNIKVNQQVGTFTFTVRENSSTDNANFEDKENNYDLAKFPYGFFVKNFTPSKPMVGDGQIVTLTWAGSDLATYTILYADKTVDVTNTRSWTSPALTNSTTFILKATAQSGGETVNTYLNATVIVANPELTATKLTVLQDSALQGATTVGTGHAPAPLTVNGDIKVAANQELFFVEGGQIRSSDNNHRILFGGRWENSEWVYKMDFREWGDIILSPGPWGDETAKMVVKADGNVGIGTQVPRGKLDVMGNIVFNGSPDNQISKNDIGRTIIKGKAVILDISPNGGGQLYIANNQGDNKIYIEGYSKDGGSSADEMLLTGWRASPVPKFTVKADNTYISGNLGTHGYPPTPIHKDWHGGIHTYDIEAEATIWARWGYVQGNLDYAEYFESLNGKEIPPAVSVVLENGKIRPAKQGENPIGIISPNPGVLGGDYVDWQKKYLLDEFGNRIMEEYKEEIMTPKKEKVKKERQETKKGKIKVTKKKIEFEDGKYFQKEITELEEIEESVFEEFDLYDDQKKNIIGKHKIPVMEIYEEEIDVLDDNGQPVMAGTGKFETKTRPKLNPEYDEKKEYISREKRPEWNCVGLLGQLRLRKGQVTAPTWVKMEDLSDNVEMWLVK